MRPWLDRSTATFARMVHVIDHLRRGTGITLVIFWDLKCMMFLPVRTFAGKVKGKRIVDIGSGPTIHSLIPAAKWFDELYLSDYCPQNLEAVQKWVGKDPGAHDWQGYFRFFAEKDGNG